MAIETPRNVELTIVYPDYDEYDVEQKNIDATITVDDDGDEWTIDAEGFDGEQSFRVVEERDKIMVAPIGEYGPSTTQTADYEPGAGRVEPQYLKYEGKYVEAIVGDAIDETLGGIVSEAREQFVSERGIQSASEFDIPETELCVREGQPLFPSSKTGQTMAPRDRLVVEPQSDDVGFDRWQDAIVATTNRYEVWAGTSSKGTDELLAPPEYDAGDTLTLPEYLDAFYTVSPEAVVDAVVPQEEIEKAEKREAKRDRLESEYPELARAKITNLDAFDEAERDGERVKVAERVNDCNDRSKECNLDHITYYATEDETVEKNRSHTY